MNRLDEAHLHLLIDEPIYVLADHGDHPAEQSIKEDQPDYSGDNLQGIAIFTANPEDDDLVFLFKGLNALDIYEKDVAVFKEDYNAAKNYPAHTKCLRFSEHIGLDATFAIQQNDDILLLNCLPIKEIRNNQDFKRQFWEALKQLFRIQA